MIRAVFWLALSPLTPWGAMGFVALALYTHDNVWLWVTIATQAAATIAYLLDEDT